MINRILTRNNCRLILSNKVNYFNCLRFYSKEFKIDNKLNKQNKKKNKRRKKDFISYEEESDLYLIKELNQSIKEFENNNKKIDEIIKQFIEIFKLFKIEIINAPLKGFDNNKGFIHLRKELNENEDGKDNKILIDILLDCKNNEINEYNEDCQILINNLKNEQQLLYLIGKFNKIEGIKIYSCNLINKGSIKNIENCKIEEIRDSICNGDNWIFKELSNIYEKEIKINEPEVIKFLTIINKTNDHMNAREEEIEDEILPELEGKQLIDGLINYIIIEMIKYGENNEKLDINNIFHLFLLYCRNYNQGKWLNEFLKFIKE